MALSPGPQDPTTQLNTFKNYVALIGDPTPGSKALFYNSLKSNMSVQKC